MFKRYKVRLGLVVIALLVEVTSVVYMFWMSSLDNTSGILTGFFQAFSIASIIYFLMFNAFLRDKYLYFDPEIKFGSLFIYLCGIFCLIVSMIIYVLNGYAHLTIMSVSLIAWFTALVFMLVFTFKPMYIAVKAKKQT